MEVLCFDSVFVFKGSLCSVIESKLKKKKHLTCFKLKISFRVAEAHPQHIFQALTIDFPMLV